ncbi:hypothetical protein [Aurantiacibacter hainanensis]|uniref:hypothetical protein n=1 Tax=Aurantiacibacter hainanensis TaxID=3076114 RepID=UPI0030C69551
MLESTRSLFAAQTARSFLPMAVDASVAKDPARAALLENFRRRNALLDALFYDIGKISQDEARSIAPHLAREGAILVVPPSGEGELVLCPTLEDYLAHGREVETIAVAGVGSSALGTAAFARNVADATGGPVAGVVSGYGLADLLTEAMGGFFWFGALNSLRHGFEMLDEMGREAMVGTESTGGTLVDAVRQSRDTRTLVALLSHPDFRFRLLTGHSKGNLVLSEALYEMQKHAPGDLASVATGGRIATVSALIRMPSAFTDVVDIFGAWDWFGGMNSRGGIKADMLVANAWHHTNTELPAHLDVTAALRSAL